MKKILIAVLGMFLFSACIDSKNNGRDIVAIENLNTSLIEVAVQKKGLGAVAVGSEQAFEIKFINKDTVNQTAFTLTGYINNDLKNGTLDTTCDYTINPDKEIMTINLKAGATCKWKQLLKMAVTNEGSPYAIYLEDANNDKLTVVIN